MPVLGWVAQGVWQLDLPFVETFFESFEDDATRGIRRGLNGVNFIHNVGDDNGCVCTVTKSYDSLQ